MPNAFGDGEDRNRLWRERADRFRALSRLLREQEGSGALADLARRIEAQIENRIGLQNEFEAQRLRSQVLVAEIGTVAARLKGTLRQNDFHPEGSSYTAEDLREESRLCIEEAKATEDIAVKRLIAWQAAALAQLAEQLPSLRMDQED